MAVYKIFASADASLYSSQPARNTGLDEILEVSVKNNSKPLNYFVDPVPSEPLLQDDLRRSLILFSNTDIEKIKTFQTGSWKTNLRLYLANAENLNTSYSLEIREVSDPWTMGTGKLSDTPQTRNGVCWYSTGSFTTATNNWTSPQYYLTPGGGSWTLNYATQSFGYKDSKDINSDVSTIVDTWFSGSKGNYGFVIKHPDVIEQNSGSYIGLSFFSVDTHTIYPPSLEIR